MDSFYTYNYEYNPSNENFNFDARRAASEVDFVDDGGSAVPLPEELTKMFKPLECELCGVAVTSEATAYTHYEGKVHMKNVNAYMKEQYNIYGSMKKIKAMFTPHQCEVCKCELSSIIQAQQHYSGKVHKKNLRKISYDPQTAIPIQSLNTDDFGSDFLKDLPPPPPPPVLSDFICEICNVTTNTEYQLIVHKNGAKHQKKIKKLKQSFGDFGTDGYDFYTGGAYNEETNDNRPSEPIITEYLPLSDAPLEFNNPQGNYNRQLDNAVDSNSEDGQSKPLCIKWFNDKTEASVIKRPIEEAWVEKFSKKDAIPKKADQVSKKDTEQPNTVSKPTIQSENQTDYVPIRTYEARPELAELPQFTVAAILPLVLQAPPSPPSSLMNDQLVEEYEVYAVVESILSRIQSTTPTPIESDKNNKNTSNPGSKSPQKTDHENKNTTVTKKKGEFITSTWKEAEDNNENNKKKKKGVNFLFGFKKQLEQQKLLSHKNGFEENKNPDNETGTEKQFKCTKKNDEINCNNDGLTDDKIGPIRELEFRYVKGLNTMELKKNENKSGYSKESKERSPPDHRNDNNGAISNDYYRTKEKSRSYNETNYRYKSSGGNNKEEEKKRRNKDEDEKEGKRKRRSRDEDYWEDKKKYKYREDSDGEKTRKHKERYDYDHHEKKKHKEKDGDVREEKKKYKDKKDGNRDEKKKRRGSDDYEKRKHRERDDDDYHHEKRKNREREDDYGDRRKEKKTHRSKDREYHDEKKKSKHSSKDEDINDKDLEQLMTPFSALPLAEKWNLINYLAPHSDYDSKDIAMYRAPSGLYYCATCDYKSTDRSEFTNHLYSWSHKDKKKTK